MPTSQANVSLAVATVPPRMMVSKLMPSPDLRLASNIVFLRQSCCRGAVIGNEKVPADLNPHGPPPHLEEELDRFGRRLPERMARGIQKVRSPAAARFGFRWELC